MILKQSGANALTPTDFEVVLQDLILFHPGLEFLSGNSVFQERYCKLVKLVSCSSLVTPP